MKREDRPFKFLAHWILQNDYKALIEWSWEKEVKLIHNISTFVGKAKIWNKDVFGHIFKKKNCLLLKMEGINCMLSCDINPFLDKLQKNLWKEYEAIVIQEIKTKSLHLRITTGNGLIILIS
ncbi:Endonuclease/exonuclease/phosphatase family protein [Arachis hypogaea]|nr:Endonuclease/exonuclease/phosphatase family protein [Arachis hypogaea]